MKTKDIAEKYGVDRDSFEIFLRLNKKSYVEGFLSMTVDDANVAAYIEDYHNHEAEKQQKKLAKQREEQERIEAEKAKKAAMTQMLISSGFSFDGYKIVKYSGYISGDDATIIQQTGVLGRETGENLTHALVKIRRQALTELKEAAYDLGCNAVVGVDFDYIALEQKPMEGILANTYIVCVTANGNAVIIEKEQE